uniref:Uncharacterized protein n=1 Tax=Hyaloperonospora arabidopsidis (strain Emoy2) TaxID=559515 RepID=M4BE99_HYAAE
MNALRAGASKADVRLERKTAVGLSVLTSEPYTPTPIGGKRVKMQADPQRDAQKRQRRTAHENSVSEVARLCESFAHVQTALDQSMTDRKQLREILDQVRRAREQSSTELTQVSERINRLVSIESVDKRLRKVEYNLSWLDGQVELLTKMQLAGTTSHPQDYDLA